MFHHKLSSYWKILAVILLILVVLTPSYVALVYAPNSTLTEWTLPDNDTGPWGIAVDQSSKVWFTENKTNRIGMLDQVTNTLREWNTPSGGSNPKYIFLKPSGSSVRVYFTEYSSDRVAYLDNRTNLFYEWSLPSNARPVGITVDNDDHIWVTESGRDAIAEIIPVSNTLNEFQLPTNKPGTANQANSVACGSVFSRLCVWGIYVQSVSTIGGTNKFVWFTESANDAVDRLEVGSHVLTRFNLRTVNPFDYGPLDITQDGAGNAVFTSASLPANRISVIRNQTSTLADFSIPTGESKPTGVKWDTVHNRVWFTENIGGKVASLDTSGGVYSFLPQTVYCTVGGSNPGAPDCSNNSSYGSSLGTNFNNPQINPNVRTVNPAVSTFASQDSGVFSEYNLPTSISGPNSVAVDSNGGIWFTEQQGSGNRIGHIVTTTSFNFGLTVNTSTVTIPGGQSANYTLNVNLIAGSTQPVSFSISPTPPTGVTYSFTPASGSPAFASTLALGTTSATPSGTYAFTVTASGGSVTKTVPINLIVVASTVTTSAFDFGLAVSGQTSADIVAGNSVSFNIGTTLIGSASPQSVQLFASGQPAGVTATFNPTTGLPPYTSTLTLSSTADTSPGTYQVAITATGGGQTHTTTVTLNITSPLKDFSMTVSPKSLNLPQASTATATIIVQSVGVFNDPVGLATSNLPGGVSVSFTPNPITPSAGGTATSTATVSVTWSVPTGTYTFSITATSGSITHSTDVTINVSGCLIATATYGSELSPEVQFLRDFRDFQILHTFAGTSFMVAFNTWYYSFSPAVAHYETIHPAVRATMKFVLYPLIGLLHVSSASYAMLSLEPEIGALTAGIIASSLVGLVYLALPVSGALWLAGRRLTRGMEKRIAKSLAFLFLTSLAGFAFSELLSIPLAMVLISSAMVLTVLAIGTLLPAFAVVEFIRRRQ